MDILENEAIVRSSQSSTNYYYFHQREDAVLRAKRRIAMEVVVMKVEENEARATREERAFYRVSCSQWHKDAQDTCMRLLCFGISLAEAYASRWGGDAAKCLLHQRILLLRL